MKVLLTGAGGFIGRYVHQSLTSRGIETIALGRTPTTAGPSVSVDLLDPVRLDGVVERVGATHLVHLAWFVEYGKFWQSPLNPVWAEATARLVDIFYKAGGRRVVGAGTCFEYALANEPVVEDLTPLRPETPYGIAKDETRRRLMEACARHGASAAWGRIFVPYGERENAQRLVPSLVAALRRQRPPFGVNRTSLRDFIHASDVGEAFATLAVSEETGVYNISTGEGVPVERLVREVAGQLDADPSPILSLASERVGEPVVIVGDSRKLRALGWRPQVPLAEGIRRVLADL